MPSVDYKQRNETVARRWYAALCTFVTLAGVIPCQAQTTPTTRPEIVSCRLGFEHAYKVGYWTPIWIELAGGSEPQSGVVEVVVPDSDGVATGVTSPPSRPVSLVPGSRSTELLYVKIGQLGSPVKVNLYVGTKRVDSVDLTPADEAASRHVRDPLSSDSQLVVVLGTSSLGVAEALPARDSTYRQPGRHTAHLTSASELPTRWYGYDGVDALVIAAGDAAPLRSLTADSARWEALRQWVELGGRVVICGAQAVPELLAPGAPLAELAPGKFAELTTIDRADALEEYSESSDAVTSETRRLELTVARLSDVRGVIEAYEGRRREDMPLVTRAARGFGEVVFAGVDLDRPPLARWQGRAALLSKLLRVDDVASETSTRQSTALMTTGYNDLAGALRQKLGENFTDVQTVSFGVVVVFVIAYILLIGPIDYYFVKNVLKRMEATWITFPLVVVLVSLAAYWYANMKKGNQLRMNQAELVDFDLTSGLARGTVWTSIFSPSSARYDLSLDAHWPDGTTVDDPQVLMSWMGLPGTGLGGMQSSSQGFGLLGATYRFTPSLDGLRDMPIQVWSTKSLVTRWHAPTAALLEADLAATGDGLLEGELTNRAGVTLRDARLLYGRWAWRLDDVADGRTVEIDADRDPIRVSTMLQGSLRETSATGEMGTNSVLILNNASIDQVLDLMMFHDAIGGYRFTNLYGRYQAQLDLSNQLTFDRAFVIGRCDEPRSGLERDGQSMRSEKDRFWTIYRFILPVSPES